jgi:heme-degrading monooxygenase HmoA
MKKFVLAMLAATLCCSAIPEREFEIEGPVEQHVWITAKAGQEEVFERTFTEVFYPALSSQEGFVSGSLLREPGTADYIIRLAFKTEEQRTAWVHSDTHNTAWPKLAPYAGEPTWEGLSLIHPR